MSNDDWQIVPERDEAISSRARPNKSPESRRTKASAGEKPSRKPSGGNMGFLVVLLLLSFAGSGYLYYKLQESNQAYLSLSNRVASMEGKLSVTDESLSQSGAAMQAVLQDHDLQLDEHMSEIRKLWGVSYDTNRSAIDELRASTSSITSNLGSAVDQIEALDAVPSRLDTLGSQLLIQATDVEDVLGRLRDTRDALNQQTAVIDQLEAQAIEHEQAISSIDEFRVQMNQRFIQLENEIRSLNGSNF